MNVWDMHCDTLSELRNAALAGRPKSFLHNEMMVDLERLKQGDYLLQCFACYVNLGKDADPLRACLQMIDGFYELLAKYPSDLMQIRTPEDIRALHGSGKIGAMLTLEEGAVCMDDPAILRNLYRLGARMMTLTWNFKNGLGEPNLPNGTNWDAWPCPPSDKGLTKRGIEFLEVMEEIRMIPDVSHLSDGGFRDVLKYTKRPFVASHSNARAKCGHVRNLTDDMIRQMAERGCLIGLNFCPGFLDPNPDRSALVSRVRDMAVHAKHIIEIGGEEILGLGSDFDGIEGELEIAGAQDMPKLAEGLLAEGLTEVQVERIFWKNAERFFLENL